MPMTIKLSCKCGATFEATGGEFINPGGDKDDRQRVFIVELRAEEWLDRHQGCLPVPEPLSENKPEDFTWTILST